MLAASSNLEATLTRFLTDELDLAGIETRGLSDELEPLLGR